MALSATEDMWELGIKILEEIKDYKVNNKIPVIAGGVFPTFAPDLCIKSDLVDMVQDALIDLCRKIEKKMELTKRLTYG